MTLAVMERGGVTGAVLGKALGRDERYVQDALRTRLSPERAGELVRALAELTSLSTRERREVFREIVNLPGEDALQEHVSSEDPFENLRGTNLGITDYEQAERDAKENS